MSTAVLKLIPIAALAACLLGKLSQPAFAQTEPVVDTSQIRVMNPGKSMLSTIHAGASATAAVNAPAALPLWQYSVVSPRDGKVYTGSMVGGNPFNRGARTTNLNVVLIPLRIQFTGTVRNFDPTSPDVGCLGIGNTAFALTQQSPIFNTVPNLTMNGVNLGTATFPDGFQRANFWSSVSGVSPAYHMALNVSITPVQTLTLVNNFSGSGGSGTFNGVTYCSTNALTADNPPRTAFIDINYIDPQLNAIIATLGLTANQFPLFVVYSTVLTDGPPATGGCCILGYHSTVSNTPTPAVPGQTYGIAEYDAGNIFVGTKDISVLSHEFLEWVNDPSGFNLVPEWGNIGQVGGCVVSGSTHTAGQNNLEVGDPLSGNVNPAITMPNGITYHPQELAFYSWFIGGPSTGAGGKYSSNGTFGGFAKPCATGGGTN